MTDSKNLTIPTDTMMVSLKIWGFFLIFNKMSLPFTIISFVLLAMILICKNYVDYYKATDEKGNKHKIDSLFKYSKLLFILNIFGLFIVEIY